MNRRDALRYLALTTSTLAAPAIVGRSVAFAQQKAPEAVFKLPPLGYAYEALEPHIDTATMRFHHQNHHNAFIGNLNGLVAKAPDIASKPMETVLSNLGTIPEAVRTPVRNSLGGHFNHTFFWDLMTPGGAKAAGGDLKSAIDGQLGGVDKIKAAVNQAGMTRFGSGWAWLGVGADKKLKVFNTPYQDSPHMDQAAKPVIGVDVWEHAYYLKHQYRRAAYLEAWWNTVNWDKAAANFRKAVG